MTMQNAEGKLYLGVDPGSSKTGLALVDAEGNIQKLLIARKESFTDDVANFSQNVTIEAVILGNGTHSKEISEEIAKLLPGKNQYFVGEAYSTEEARKLYWEVNPPQGLKKFVPLGLLSPSEPLDAYAAVVQVRRWLAQQK